MSLPAGFQELLEALRDLFFPLHCAGCGMAIETPWTCSECAEEIDWIKKPRCETCSHPFDGLMDAFSCINCRDRAFYFECAVAVAKSRGCAREFIHRFKYKGELWLAGPLTDILERGLEDERFCGWRPDAIVPVPLHRMRRREREYNQSAILAQELGRRLKVPVFEPLERIRYTATQTHFDRSHRMQNLRDAFVMRQNGLVQGKHLLLVDDVFTTGSTLNECARVLIEAGAQSVRALTVLRG